MIETGNRMRSRPDGTAVVVVAVADGVVVRTRARRSDALRSPRATRRRARLLCRCAAVGCLRHPLLTTGTDRVELTLGHLRAHGGVQAPALGSKAAKHRLAPI